MRGAGFVKQCNAGAGNGSLRFCVRFLADRLRLIHKDLQDSHIPLKAQRRASAGHGQFRRDILSRSSTGQEFLYGRLFLHYHSDHRGRSSLCYLRILWRQSGQLLMRPWIPWMSIPPYADGNFLAGSHGRLTNMVIAIAIADIPGMPELSASVLTIKDQNILRRRRVYRQFSDARIILKHIIPNCIAPIIVQATLGMAGAILYATSSLSFLGTGHPAVDYTEWGSMLSSETVHQESIHICVIFPRHW